MSVFGLVFANRVVISTLTSNFLHAMYKNTYIYNKIYFHHTY